MARSSDAVSSNLVPSVPCNQAHADHTPLDLGHGRVMRRWSPAPRNRANLVAPTMDAQPAN
jgi:hypothetical protein